MGYSVGYSADIKVINSVLPNIPIPLNVVYKDSLFLALAIKANMEFKDGRWGDEVIAHTIEVVDTVDFHHLHVKIEGKENPLMPDEELQRLREEGTRVGVEFENASIMLYVNRKKQSLEDSVKADGVKVVSTE